MKLLGALLYSTWPIPSFAYVSQKTSYKLLLSQPSFASVTTLMQFGCKRPRLHLSTVTSETSNSNTMLERSPYEQRIGKFITLCPKCHGEGKLRGALSKKAKAKKKQMQSTDSKVDGAFDSKVDNLQAPKKPCKECNSTGLLLQNPTQSNVTSNIFPSSDLNVAIIGGGIGGIALAAALQHRNINCVVYERDTSFEERKQGYGLTMQQGARALKSLGFLNDDEDSTASGGVFGIHSTRHAVHTPDGTMIGEWGLRVWGGRYEKNGRSHATRQNAHISRQNLRKILMDLLRPGTIQWGYRFMGYDGSANLVSCGSETPLNLKFLRRIQDRDGEEMCVEERVRASVLVGCDGIRSAVRTFKLGDEMTPLRFLDCIVILGIGPSPQSSLTDGRTVFQTADGTTRLYAMPFAKPGEELSGFKKLNGRGLSMWQLSFPMGQAEANDLSQLGASALKAEALRRCGGWHDPIPELLQSTPEVLVTGYPCYDRSLVDKDYLRKGLDDSQSINAFVTVLGDAAHPMSPFKGQGANQALLDAVLLAQKLFDAIRKNDKARGNVHDLVPDALAEFEAEMLQRCAVKVKKSADAATFLHSEVAITEGNVTRGAAADGLIPSDEAD